MYNAYKNEKTEIEVNAILNADFAVHFPADC